MTTSALESLNGALYTALTADGPLAALVGTRVFDTRAPDGTAFDYITLGDASENESGSFGGDGSDAARTIHLWTRDSTTGTARIFALWGHVRRILSDTLAVAGRAIWVSDVSLVTVVEDPDDPDRLTMHGVVRFHASTEAT